MACIACAALASCTVGPDFQRPQPPSSEGYSAEPLAIQQSSDVSAGGSNQRLVPDLDIPAQWWTLFGSEPLTALIEEALKSNADLQSAQAALRVAQENARAQKGGYYPSVSAAVSASRNKTATGSLSAASASGNPSYTLYSTQVDVLYAPDIFGAISRSVESLEAQSEVRRFELEDTYLALSANLATAVIQEASLRGQIQAMAEILSIENELLGVLQRQNNLGQIAMADVVAQEATVAQTMQTLPGLEKQLAQQRNLLAALAGRLPAEVPAHRFQLSELHLPGELPVSLPARLVEQRPDVRAAEAALHAASAQVGVAIANRLPNFNLTATAGAAGSDLAAMFTPGGVFWNLIAGLTQPIFQGGTLLHRQKAAEAAYDQASAQYRATVITAFQNVADALHALASDAQAMNAAVAALRAAERSLDIVRRQLQIGQINYTALLAIEQLYQQARLNVVQAQSNRLSDSVVLFRALGGGWWNRANVGQTETGALQPNLD